MSLSKKTDLELIAEFKRGNTDSFEELIQRYSDKAFSLSYRLTRNFEDAQEALQDVFTTVYRKVGSFEGRSSFSSWLYRITVNASLMKLRKRKQDPSVSIEDALPQFQEGILGIGNERDETDRGTLRHQVRGALEEAISKLPDDYRPVYVLRDIDGLTSREVSKILNITVPAVKSRLHRSRLMLRRRLVRFYKEYLTGTSDNKELRKVENG